VVEMVPALFAEIDSPLLKTFLINRLKIASEADPDVLSDYILALLRHDQSPEEVMQTCITQLADFISNGTQPPFPQSKVDL
jgi:RNA-binding protein 26